MLLKIFWQNKIIEYYLINQVLYNYLLTEFSMKNIPLDFIIHVSKLNMILWKYFDSSLGLLGLNEFIVLYYLNASPDKTLRRIDLAEKVWLTASGITRMLLPMEKIGLVEKKVNPNDARVSLVSLASGGKKQLDEALIRIQEELDDKITPLQSEKLWETTQLLKEIGTQFLWR